MRFKSRGEDSSNGRHLVWSGRTAVSNEIARQLLLMSLGRQLCPVTAGDYFGTIVNYYIFLPVKLPVVPPPPSRRFNFSYISNLNVPPPHVEGTGGRETAACM